MCSQWGAALLATPRVRLKSKPGGRVHIQMVTRRELNTNRCRILANYN